MAARHTGKDAEQAPDALPAEFRRQLQDLERSYLTYDDPLRQSGFYGGEQRWRRERIVVLDAVEGGGDFLDVGCASGYLLQCLVVWAKEKGLALTPYGVDQGARLIELARKRLPTHAANFWVGNAWDWVPPRRFRYVYALWDCVPEAFFCRWVRRLLKRCTEPGGTLIIGAYGSTSRDEPARDVAGDLRRCGLAVAGRASCGALPITSLAWVRR